MHFLGAIRLYILAVPSPLRVAMCDYMQKRMEFDPGLCSEAIIKNSNYKPREL
jgi:hypothetical protein